MSIVQILRSLLRQRLPDEEEEIFELFERTTAEYEDELCGLKEENERQRKLLDAAFNPHFNTGTEFGSYEEFQQALNSYQEQNYVQFYRRSSRSIEQQVKRAPKKSYNMELQFGELDYSCIHGGKKFKSGSTGQRPNRPTFQQECPCFFKVRVTADGQRLMVKSANFSHNHDLSETVFKNLPQQRKLTTKQASEAAQMLKMQASKKLVQAYIQEQTGKLVTLKDLHNLAGRSTGKPTKPTDHDIIMEDLCAIPGSTVQMILDNSKTLEAMFFQTAAMKSTFSHFPELILVDATYKINDLQMAVYLLMVEDGNGESEVVCVWLVASETRSLLQRLMTTFKEHNPDWTSIKCVMTDKDMAEREVLAEELPDASFLICLFHTLRTFCREISTEKMNISQQQRQTVIELLQKMVYAETEDQYMELYAMMQKTQISAVTSYFNSNWHTIRRQWVQGLQHESHHLLNVTSNRLEVINQKLKSVITRYSGLAQFFRELLTCLNSLNLERDHRAVSLFQKQSIRMLSEDDPIHSYQTHLTPHAFNYVSKQFALSKKLSIPDGGAESVDVNGVTVTSVSCTCGFFTSVKLPCRHILAYRRSCNLDLFHAVLCAQRWTRSFYRKRHRAFLDSDSDGSTSPDSQFSVRMNTTTQRTLTQDEKYRQSFQLCHRLATLLSELPSEEFPDALQQLKDYVSLLERGQQAMLKKVSIMDVEDPVPYSSSTDSDIIHFVVTQQLSDEPMVSQPSTDEELPASYPQEDLSWTSDTLPNSSMNHHESSGSQEPPDTSPYTEDSIKLPVRIAER